MEADADKPTPGVPLAAAMPRSYVDYIDQLYNIPADEQQRNFQLSLQRAHTQPSLLPKRASKSIKKSTKKPVEAEKSSTAG